MDYKENVLSTMSGMWGVWDYNSYAGIDTYEAWEKEFCEDDDILRQIRKSLFVPIYIHTDGACMFRVKVDTPLSEREKQYTLVTSEEYLLKTEGKVVVSGIDCIGNLLDVENSIMLDLKSGNYSVKICLIDWEQEPGAVLEDGSPSDTALPDFIILISSDADVNKPYCKVLETFHN